MLRRLIAIVVALGAGLVTADVASATFVDASVSVQGAGQIRTNAFPVTLCDRDGNADDRVTVACGRAITADPDDGTNPPVTLVLSAVPRGGAGGQVFRRWEGCDSPATSNPCLITAVPGTNRSGLAPRAVFDDVRAPVAILGEPFKTGGIVSFPSLAADEDPAQIECSVDGGGFAPCTAATRFTVGEGQHVVRARARDASGNVGDPVSASTLAAVPPPAPPTFTDRDDDGVDARADCDDTDPDIRPGRPELPGNAADEDCDGTAQPLPRLRVRLAYEFRAAARATTLTKLQLRDVPRDATVRVSCARCPGTARAPYIRRGGAGTVSLKRYSGLRLKPGTTITVTVTRPGSIRAVKRLEIRRAKAPRVTDRA